MGDYFFCRYDRLVIIWGRVFDMSSEEIIHLQKYFGFDRQVNNKKNFSDYTY